MNPESRIQHFISEIPFVSIDKEDDYCKRNHIEVRRLDNGMQLVGMSNVVEDKADAKVRLVFPTGAYHDPFGKTGLHHLMEHLIIDPNLERIARENGVGVNGSTSSQMLDFSLKGIANPSVKEYGIWKCISQFNQMITKPFACYNDFDLAIEGEKKVVQREIAQRQTGDEWEASNFVSRTLYAPENPVHTNVPGTLEDLQSISSEDLSQLAARVLIPDKATLFVSSVGDISISRELLDQLEMSSTMFPGNNLQSKPIDKSLYGHLNPDLTPGRVYTREVTTNNAPRKVNFVWEFENQPYSIKHLAMTRLLPHIYNHFHDFARSNGLSYSVNVDSHDMYDKKLFNMSLPMDANIATEHYLTSVLGPEIKSLLSRIPIEDLQSTNSREQLIQRAIPMDKGARFNILYDGIVNYQKLINADLVKAKYLEITVKDLQTWLDKIVSTDPIMIIS